MFSFLNYEHVVLSILIAFFNFGSSFYYGFLAQCCLFVFTGLTFFAFYMASKYANDNAMLLSESALLVESRDNIETETGRNYENYRVFLYVSCIEQMSEIKQALAFLTSSTLLLIF